MTAPPEEPKKEVPWTMGDLITDIIVNVVGLIGHSFFRYVDSNMKTPPQNLPQMPDSHAHHHNFFTAGASQEATEDAKKEFQKRFPPKQTTAWGTGYSTAQPYGAGYPSTSGFGYQTPTVGTPYPQARPPAPPPPTAQPAPPPPGHGDPYAGSPFASMAGRLNTPPAAPPPPVVPTQTAGDQFGLNVLGFETKTLTGDDFLSR